MILNFGNKTRIVAIDWLEVYVSESPAIDYSPDGFRSRGYEVKERPYGTKTFVEMFTVCDVTGTPMIEVRRRPRTWENNAKFHIYQQYDAYLRLTNIYCYCPNPVSLLLSFMTRESYSLKNIYRIDLAMDFQYFDTGELPWKIARRMVNHNYTKVNQTNRRTSGIDTWTECRENWLSWGAKGSMVSTKFYNKTKEIQDNKMDKYWILSEWMRAGLIDSPAAIMKEGKEVEVWRLEFSIHSSAKGWLIVQKSESEDGAEHYLEHTLDLYGHPLGVLTAIRNLIPHYFKWRIYEKDKRKSLCKEKVLFRFGEDEGEKGYRLINESDLHRVRNVAIDNDIRCVRHMAAAAQLSPSADMTVQLNKLIIQLNSMISEKTLNFHPSQGESVFSEATSVDVARVDTKNKEKIR